MVATGYPSDRGVKTEIVDILDQSKSCLLEDISHRYGSTGGLLGTTPVICGGRFASGSGNIWNECLLYGTQQVITMNSKNYQHASVGLNSSMIWILGGYWGGSDVLDTTEFITEIGITVWILRAYCNFAVRVVHAPTHPWPSALNSNILSRLSVDGDAPPTNITPFPSGLVAIALSLIA